MEKLFTQLHFLFDQFHRLEDYLKQFGVESSIDTRKKIKNVLSRLVILDTMYKYIDQFGIVRFASELFEIEADLKWLYIFFDLDWITPQTSQNSTAEQ